MTKERFIELEMEKREEIVNTFNKNYLLEAGAGAGKTTIIVQRIINHIIKEEIDPSRLVAITFTKAASMELAERIQLKALEYLKTEKDPRVIERLKSVDRIFTGTIHSFCELILKEMPFDAGMTPNYEIIEDSEDFHNHIWNSFLRDRQKEYKEIIDLLKSFNIDYRELRPKAILALENPDIEFIGYENDSSFAAIRERFEEVKDKYGYLSGEPFKNTPNLAKLFKNILEEKEDLEYYLTTILKEMPKREDNVEASFEKLIAKKFWDSEYSPAYMELIGEMGDIYEDLNALIYNTATDFINMLLEYKNNNYQNKLTFNELLFRASRLIKESTSAREHYSNKYRHFYIDEFQDTDPMQAELILYLTHHKDNNCPSWEEAKPMPGSLFVVGDPKQSIYRFRRADILIYNKVKNIVEENGEVVYLDINFRSSDRICNWVESTFKDRDGFAFKERATDIQAGFNRILSLWDDSQEIEDEGQLSGLYSYSYPDKEELYVANLIEEILENYYIMEKERKEDVKKGERDYYNVKRKVKPGDIMILTKTNKETGLYLRALKDKGIAALLAGEKQLGDTREVLNLFILIDALLDYRDDIKILSALRNSFYIDLDTIDLFIEDNKTLSPFIFNRRKIEKINHFTMKKAFSYLNGIIHASREERPIVFLERLIESRTGIYDIHKDYGALEERDAESALRQAMEVLRAKNCGSLYEVREELKKLIDQPVNYELPLSRDEAENAIRIMNIHKAKGLEANIVILAGGDKARNVFGDSHYVDRNESNKSIGYMVYRSDHGVLCPGEAERKSREREFKEAEVDRLLYVAATRAKSVLIVAEGEGRNLFLGPLTETIERKIESNKEVEYQEVDRSLSLEKRRELELTEDLWVKKEILESSYTRISPSNFYLADERKDLIPLSSRAFKGFEHISTRKETEIYKGPRGNEYGNIVHRAMEILIGKSNGLKDLSPDIIQYAIGLAIDEVIDKLEINKTNIGLLYSSSLKDIEYILDISRTEGSEKARKIIKAKVKFYLEKLIRNFINNEEIREIFENADLVLREVPFTIGIGSEDRELLDKLSRFLSEDMVKFVRKENKKILINGVIDLVVKSRDENWLILDYKSDISLRGNLEATLRQRYTGQLEGYKILFEEICKDENIEIEDLLIYSTFEDRLISLYSKASMSC